MRGSARPVVLLLIATAVNPLLAEAVAPGDAVQVFCAESGPRTALPRVQIIVDNSRSMTGFLRAKKGDVYRRALENLMSKLGQPIVRPLNATTQRVPAAQMLDETFYSEGTTPLGNAFKVARDDRRGDVFVLVTDLAQDRSQLGQASSVLAEALKTKRALLIVGAESAFSAPRCSPDCDAEMKVPFYFVVLAPTPEILREFESRVGLRASTVTGRNSPNFFFADGPALEADAINLTSSSRDTNWRLDAGGGLAEPYCRSERAYRKVLFVVGTPETKSPLQLRLRVKVNTSLSTMSAARVEITYVDTGDRRPNRSEASKIRHDRGEIPIYEPTDLEITYQLDPPPESGWRTYRIRYLTDQDSLATPVWVTEWNGRIPPVKNEVYVLRDFVNEALRSPWIQQRPIIEHFVVVRQR